MENIGFKPRNESNAQKTPATNIAPIDFRHILIEGQTGSGKTTSCIYPIVEDRIEKGHGMIFHSYKGHEIKTIKMLAQKHDRLENVHEIGTPVGIHTNLLQIVNIEQFKDAVKEHYSSQDPYWINTTTNWCATLISTFRTLHNISKIATAMMETEAELKEHLDLLTVLPKVVVQKNREKETVFSEYDLDEEPTFKAISQFTRHPRTFLYLIESLENYFETAEEEITKIVQRSKAPKHRLQRLFLEYKKAKEKAQPILEISLEPKGSGSGNNGVLEMLNNLLQIVGEKEFFNKAEDDILDILEKGEILVVDMENIPQFLHSLFYILIAERLTRRIKKSDRLVPISIFVDEANKVLPKEIELYNDVFRESKVELVLSYQNEDQMIEKFGLHKWQSFKENFAHKYRIEKIEKTRKLHYNDEPATIKNPVIVPREKLMEADANFYSLPHNRKRIEERFMYDELPEKFGVNFSAVEFEQNGEIEIEEYPSGKKTRLLYASKNIIEEFEELFAKNEYHNKPFEYTEEEILKEVIFEAKHEDLIMDELEEWLESEEYYANLYGSPIDKTTTKGKEDSKKRITKEDWEKMIAIFFENDKEKEE